VRLESFQAVGSLENWYWIEIVGEERVRRREREKWFSRIFTLQYTFNEASIALSSGGGRKLRGREAKR